ncbi:hypothetical protein MTR67_042890 [Solanum verrucosum]|uniref:Uncharacterized protein n=1 Tax=Solanum verrucosum TaxID=315347 RepID=A0AAF0ZU55_SOLVR|nr:hypothetical protein MTR67_042890 [Solanum verrucosum]
MMMKGGDSSFVHLLPNGISIVQDFLATAMRSFSYSEPASPAKVGDVSGEPHLLMPIYGVGSRLRLSFAPVDPKEFGENCSCKLFLY